MPIPIQLQNKGEMRRSIGINLGICIVGAADSTVDKTSLTDTSNLQGGDDTHLGKQVLIYDAAGSIADGEKQFVTDYAESGSDATTGEFSQNITSGDKYEMWTVPWRTSDIDDVINQAIQYVTPLCLKEYQVATNYTEKNIYEYDWITTFKSINKVEYVAGIGVWLRLDSCESVWDNVDADVTGTLDTSIQRTGNSCIKFVVAAGLAAGDYIATQTVTERDLSNCDKVALWIYSTIDLTAAQLKLALDDTAACVSPVELIDFPAVSKDTWTRVVLTLANPELDIAIISMGIEDDADVGACTIYIDDFVAYKELSKRYVELSPQYWDFVRDGTNYLKFTSAGLAVMKSNTQVRLTGLQLPALLADDTTDSEIDPQFIIDWCMGRLLIGHAKSNRLDIEGKANKAKFYLGLAEARKISISSAIPVNTRWI